MQLILLDKLNINQIVQIKATLIFFTSFIFIVRDIKSDQIQLGDGIAKLSGFGFTVELEGGHRSSLVSYFTCLQQTL